MSIPSNLAELAAAQRDEIEAELRHMMPTPDLADVFARARDIDESAIPEGLHSVPGSPSADAGAEVRDVGLSLFATALRGEVEEDVAERGLSPVRAANPRAVRWGRVLAVAAAILLGLTALQFVAPEIAQRDEAPTPMVEPMSQELQHSALPLQPHEPRRPPHRRKRPAEEETVDAEPAPAPAIEADVQPKPRPRHRRTLDELEEEASALWSSGELEAAEAMLRRITARAGRTTRAELAYGDLFALARQRGGEPAQSKVWREYLRRFPNGRYSDDAQAGLCLRTADDERVECWQAYLRAHPSGAHVAHARPYATRSIPK